jgi:DNA-cytosine methyltransferase
LERVFTHANLFSGIGGFDYAAEIAGLKNIFQVEINEFCQKVLEKNFPEVERYKDIKEFDGRKYRGAIDVLSASPPCQAYSIAGKRKGSGDERHLIPETIRVIREIKPAWLIIENVYGLVNIEGGMVFEQMCLDLEAEGYEVQPFVIPAAGVDAWHKRDRLWIVAHAGSALHERGLHGGESAGEKGEGIAAEHKRPDSASGVIRTFANPDERKSGSRIIPIPDESAHMEFGTDNTGLRPNTNADGNAIKNIAGEVQGEMREGEGEERKRERMRGEFGAVYDKQGAAYDAASTGLEVGGYESGEQKVLAKDGAKLGDSDATNAESKRQQRECRTEQNNSLHIGYSGSERWSENWYEVAARICGVANGISGGMDETGEISEVSESYKKATNSKKKRFRAYVRSGRAHRLTALGNAIVPQVAVEIFKMIKEVEEHERGVRV